MAVRRRGGRRRNLALLTLEIWIPWSVARLWATPFVYFTWPGWRLVGWILYPLVLEARLVEALLQRLSGRVEEPQDEESFGEEIRTIVTEGHREGLLEEDAREMIEGVMQLGAVDVSQVMTPRTDMISFPISQSWEELLEFAVQAEHTRIPVYSKSRDDIVGILFTKDLLPELAKPPRDACSLGRSCCASPTSCPKPSRSTCCCRNSNAPASTWRWSWTNMGAFPGW